MQKFKYFTLLLFVLVNSFCVSYSQSNTSIDTKSIDHFLVNENYTKADSTLNAQLNFFKNKNLLDSLSVYTYYIGKLTLIEHNRSIAIEKAELFAQNIMNNSTSNKAKYTTLISLADFYDEVDESNKSLSVTEDALDLALTAKRTTQEDIGKIRYNIGVNHLNMGSVEKAKIYFLNGLKDYKSYKKTNPQSLSDANNALGATMWMSSKLDSAAYYFNNAIKAINSAKGDTIENRYLSTVIKSNVSLLEHSQGKLSEAIKTQKEVITNYQSVIDHSLDEKIKVKAKSYQLRAISNLASFYNEFGDLFKANSVLEYALKKSKSVLAPNDADICTIQIQLGQSQLSLKNYDKAINYLNKGIDNFRNASADYTYWIATGNHGLAEAYNAKGDNAKAKFYFEEAELQFERALGTNFDKEFLQFLTNKALFLAQNGDSKDAIETGEIAYNYVIKNNHKDSFAILKHIQNLSEIYYTISDFDNAKKWAKKGIALIERKSSSSKTQLDAIKLSFRKPNLLLIDAKANYQLVEKKEPKLLLQLAAKLNDGLTLIEQRKTLITNQNDINVIIDEYKRLSDFAKTIYLELYNLTNNQIYLEKIVALHESSIYHKIRSRLNLKNTHAFADIPKEIIKREKELKTKMTSSLEVSNSFDDFFLSQKNWDKFLDTLKRNYPRYYKMRYATINKPLNNLQDNIPKNTTLIRYLFIKHKLYAIVITKTNKELFELNTKDLEKSINTLGKFQSKVKNINKLYKGLYDQLWLPFADNISTDNVIIFPDGVLFNLSFECLTPQSIITFREMTTNSLLSKYTIAYNYSLLLVNKNDTISAFEKDFIAFAPEFNDAMKKDYQIAISDSIHLDKTYLKLLPQPFTIDLAQEYSKLFNGESFLNEKASKDIFTQNAKEHKIIHIGTHAESNNLSPELSRLIFAKSASDEDNSLYTYEIYNQNLASNLAILTACETGKPTYQAGEGMISLAHAFNYAGSESILTSLWKIDEQSSAEILKYFYDNLSNGMTKDEALKKAKLNYISNAEGRTIAPQYWAGLVLIGDTSPIDLNTSESWIWWLIMGIVIILLFLILIRNGKKLRKTN